MIANLYSKERVSVMLIYKYYLPKPILWNVAYMLFMMPNTI